MSIEKIFQKIKDNIFLIPTERFDTLAADKSLMDSFVYYLVLLAITMPFNIIISIISHGATISAIIGALFGAVLIIPLFYLSCVIMFALLKIVGGKADLSRTIQVFIYGGTCGTIFSWIPLLNYLASLVSLSNIVLGSARIHQIPLWKAVLVIVVVPIIIFIILAVMASIAMMSLFSGGFA